MILRGRGGEDDGGWDGRGNWFEGGGLKEDRRGLPQRQ